MTTTDKTALDRLQEQMSGPVNSGWLDANKDDVLEAITGYGVDIVGKRLGVSKETLRTWRRRRGLNPNAGAGDTKKQDSTPAQPSNGNGGYSVIPLDDIVPNPWQTRKTIDPEYLEGLSESIHTSGLLQIPVGRRKSGKVELAFGHQRIEAIRLLAQKGRWEGGAPIILRDLTDAQMAIFALEENAKRKDINPLEQLQGFKKVIDDGLLSVAQLAESVGQARPTVSNSLRILNLPKTALDEFSIGNLTKHSALDMLCFWASDHSHDDDIDAVIKGIKNPYAGVPDWSIKAVCQHIHNRVSGGNAQAWRPLDPKALSGYGRPNFDVEAFKREFPTMVHTIPDGVGDGSTAWTCNVREWRRLQSAATRAATKAHEEPPKAQTLTERDAEVYIDTLAHDPVVQAIRAGGKVETEPAEVPTGTPQDEPHGEHCICDECVPDPKGEQYKLLNQRAARGIAHILQVENGRECALADSPEDCPGCSAEEGEDIFEMEVLRHHLGLDLLSDIEIQRALEKAVTKAAAGEEEEEVQQIPDVDTDKVGDWQTLQENLGTRARLIQLWKGRRPGFMKALDAPGDLPRGFPDLEECRQRCTWGAVYGQEWEGSRNLRLYCTNQSHFNEKKAKGEELWRAWLQERQQQETAEDQAVALDIIARSAITDHTTFLRSIVLGYMAEQRWQEIVKPGGWNEEDLFYEYSTSAKIREILDMPPVDLSSRHDRDLRFVDHGYGSPVLPEVAAKVEALDLVQLQELLGQMIAFSRRKHRPGDSHPSPSFVGGDDDDDEGPYGDWDDDEDED